MIGSESSDWEKRATELVHEALPNSVSTILPGHGHIAVWTEPELVARLLVDFLLTNNPPGLPA
jgi:pimeloyl-ACP methyl ester carboxylesterase